MKMLSTGLPSTLGSYHRMCSGLFGNGSPSALFFEQKIMTAPGGAEEEVLADERQMLRVVLELEKDNIS